MMFESIDLQANYYEFLDIVDLLIHLQLPEISVYFYSYKFCAME